MRALEAGRPGRNCQCPHKIKFIESEQESDNATILARLVPRPIRYRRAPVLGWRCVEPVQTLAMERTARLVPRPIRCRKAPVLGRQHMGAS